MKATGRPLIISTGRSTTEEIEAAVDVIGRDRLLIAHSTSSYPCPPAELNLMMIQRLKARYADCPIGYSEEGFVSITPLRLDLTNEKELNEAQARIPLS